MKPPHISYRPGVLTLIDQTKLPAALEFIELRSADQVAQAIRDMQVRGAPAIGIAAAYGMAIAAHSAAGIAQGGGGAAQSPPGGDEQTFMQLLGQAAAVLAAARPTAVNLTWAVNSLLASARRRLQAGQSPAAVAEALAADARAMHDSDIATCRRIGAAGAALLSAGCGVLTHCNTGDLATGGYGTALGIIRCAWREGKLREVFVGETRPRLQGARLTAWELAQDGISHTLIADSMAAHFMQRRAITTVVVGADRIARNGDTANKIGTYALAVLADAHRIPFIVAAPSSSFDADLASGVEIPIEERDGSELLSPLDGIAANGARARSGRRELTKTANPAFDVTPAEYISAIVTEFGVLEKPFEPAIAKLCADARQRQEAPA
jgi:methylthioribose-1-phosphate isomerase